MDVFDSRYAITFGEMYYTHDGIPPNQHTVQHSFSVQDLKLLQHRLLNHDQPIQSQLFSLEQNLPEQLRKGNEAAVLLIPGMANIMLDDKDGDDKLFEQQKLIEYDRKYYDRVMKKTFNRKARYHMIFGDKGRQASQDYKQYTIQQFNQLKYLRIIRSKLGQLFNVNEKISKEYIQNYYAQGVHYFEESSGLGFHGDDGRKVVIGLCLGRTTTLRYCWRSPNRSDNGQFAPIDIEVKHGDIYIMSRKATGNDWKKRSQYRVLHAAGAKKYISI